jgi:hypothetical protein
VLELDLASSGLPAAAANWTNAKTLDFSWVQQQKVAAFASLMHARLGAASCVSRLNEQLLVMIANAVLGGWGLLKEWRHERAGKGWSRFMKSHRPEAGGGCETRGAACRNGMPIGAGRSL